MPTPLLEIFDDLDLSKTKCIHLSENYEEDLKLEKVSVSKYSPSVVKDKEYLARQLFSPIHIDLETGDIKAAAFTDSFDKGLSVNRILYSTEEEIHQLGEDKVERDRDSRPDRKYMGFITAKVSDIRQSLEAKKRIFVVYDTALEKISSHADLCVLLLSANESSTPLPKKAARKKRRYTLKNLFGNLTTP